MLDESSNNMKKNNYDVLKRIIFLPKLRKRILIIGCLFFILLLSASLFVGWEHLDKTAHEMAFTEAKATYNKDLVYRRWATIHGGVYAPISDFTPPNPYLEHIPERDITTPSGKKLTLINPAYMTRQVHTLGREQYGAKGHITSLNPIRPENHADEWETKALMKFETGAKEEVAIVELDGKPYFRAMFPMITEEKCLKCHAHQGYHVGDIRGGISTSIPLEPYYSAADESKRTLLISHILIALIGVAGFWLANNVYSQSESTVLESEKKFKSYIELAPDAIFVVNRQGYYIDANSQSEIITGYSKEELLKMHISHLIYKEDLQNAFTHFEMVLQNGKSFGEFRFVRKDGTVGWWSVNAVQISENQFLGFSQDISEKKSKEIELLESYQTFADVVNCIPSGLYIYEYQAPDKLILLQGNRGSEELTGLKLDYIIGKEFDDIWTRAKEVGITEKYLNVMKTGENIEFFDVNYQDEKVTGAFRNNCFKMPNNRLGVAFENITKIMEQESQILNQNKELIIAKDKAEESVKLKTSFLQNMSHEIRTPLNGIIGFSTLLKDFDSLDNEEKESYISLIQSSSYRLLSIVNDVLDISRIDAGTFKLNITKFKAKEIIDYFPAIYSSKADAKGIKFIVNKMPEIDNLYLNTDKDKLFQIITNFINNAIKFTDSGNVELGITLIDDCVQIFIKDTGIGIKDEFKDKIFDRFWQYEAYTSRKFGGTGLGLSITKGLAELLDCSIEVQSEYGKGSTFTLKFSNKICEYLDKNYFENNDERSEHLIYNKMKILIAEDEITNYLYLEKLLKNESAKILWVTNGADAVKIVQNEHVDLILMDIKMPIMNGIEATKQIKHINPEIPIIAQTAFSHQEEKSQALQEGCDGFISKPIEKFKLFGIINQTIKRII